MPAMPSPVAFTSTPTTTPAIAAKFVAGGNDTDVATTDSAKPLIPFSSHLQRLLGEQLATGSDGGLPVTPAGLAVDAETADELAALLPFIDALGLTQSVSTVELIESIEHAPSEQLADGATFPLVLPTTPSAANPSIPVPIVIENALGELTGDGATAPQAVFATPSSANPSSPIPALIENVLDEWSVDGATNPLASPAAVSITNPPVPTPAISAAQTPMQVQAQGTPLQTPIFDSGTTQPIPSPAPQFSAATNLPTETSFPGIPNPSADAGIAVSNDELSAGREFSAQLVNAIAASKEQPHAPGNTAGAVHQAMSGALPRDASDTHADMTVSRPVGSAEWGEELGNRIAWLANRSESRADLVLNPPHMGRVEVNLTVKGDQATANFVSNNPVVRETLEAALPRLREILAEAGIQLGQSQVSADNPRQWAQQEKHGDNSASDLARTDERNTALFPVNSGSLSTSSGLKGGRSLVDVFA